ncbi:hypothetical protein JRY29_07740 [Salmonella enterica subsp. enterica serovar Kentucky]|nr:hypothetical protein JRY29_07740 [Salmonella enterica subsp. enterica serovar Kentucky]
MIMQRLSLLARGTRLHAKIPVVGARFIPAGAGTPSLPLRIFEGFRFIPLAREHAALIMISR